MLKIGDRVKTRKGTGIIVLTKDKDILVKHDNDIGTYDYNSYYGYQSDKEDLWCFILPDDSIELINELAWADLAKLYS